MDDEPYVRRRERLEALQLTGRHWQTPPYQVGHGRAMLQASLENGLEGVIAKRLDSLYEMGRRSGAWLKVKNRQRQELVIGGWVEGEGRRRGLPGAVLLGYYDGDRFVYAGKTGTGFTNAISEWTSAGDLRAPSFKGLREDKNPRHVVREVAR